MQPRLEYNIILPGTINDVYNQNKINCEGLTFYQSLYTCMAVSPEQRVSIALDACCYSWRQLCGHQK